MVDRRGMRDESVYRSQLDREPATMTRLFTGTAAPRASGSCRTMWATLPYAVGQRDGLLFALGFTVAPCPVEVVGA
jgi:hypothetical protein